MDAVCLRGFGFVKQVQLIFLIALQQGDHYIDSRPAASCLPHPQASPLLLAESQWPTGHATDQQSRKVEAS